MSRAAREQRAAISKLQQVMAWPSQDIVLFETFVQESILLFANTPPCLGTPPHPFIAHTIAQYTVSSRPAFIAILAVQYWQ